jgi:hypothetical protein
VYCSWSKYYNLNISLIKYYLFHSYSMVYHLPPILYLTGLLIEWSDSMHIHSFWYNSLLSFWILIIPFLYTFVTGYGPVQGVDNYRIIPGVSNNTWSPNLFSFWLDLLIMSCFRFCIWSKFALKAILRIISLPNTSWHGVAYSVVWEVLLIAW